MREFSPDDGRVFLECVAESPMSSWLSPDCSQTKVFNFGPALQALGYSPGEITEDLGTYRQLMHPEDGLRLFGMLQGRVEKKIAGDFAFEFRMKRKDGIYAWFRLTVSLFRRNGSGSMAAFGVARMLPPDDQGERTTLRLSRDALDALLNEIGHPVVLMAIDGKVLRHNEATQRVIAGAMPSHPAELRFCPFLHAPDGAARMADFIDAAIQSGQRQEREIFRFNRWWRVHLVPLRNSGPDIRHLLLLAEDISAIKAEQEAALAREKALTHTLVREVHHRIKNHLQGLVGLLRLNSGARHAGVGAIDDAIAQIHSIAAVHGLLAENGDASISLAKLLEQIVATAQIGAQVPVNCTINPACQAFKVRQEDAVPIALAVGELLQNALKHTEVTPLSRIDGRLSCPDDVIELAISNSPAQLPEGFSLESSVNTGLDLVQALLPRDRSTLSITQEGNTVTARLRLALLYA